MFTGYVLYISVWIIDELAYISDERLMTSKSLFIYKRSALV